MNIKLWYSKSMKQWRWTLIDENLDQASGQQSDLRDAMEEIAKTVERFGSK
tara:strand:+ start:282 stop:434 length:153 start_codon:yes stop_codon:yes gene_type:complete